MIGSKCLFVTFGRAKDFTDIQRRVHICCDFEKNNSESNWYNCYLGEMATCKNASKTRYQNSLQF